MSARRTGNLKRLATTWLLAVHWAGAMRAPMPRAAASASHRALAREPRATRGSVVRSSALSNSAATAMVAAPAELCARAEQALRAVRYDALGPAELIAGVSSTDVISLGMVNASELSLAPDGSARLRLRTRVPHAPAVVELARACERALVAALALPRATVACELLPTPANSGQASLGLQQVAHVVAVGSCKGGVGKSTTAVNLAFALSALGARVGLVDVDIYGPSLPTMVTPESSPRVQTVGSAILPLERAGVLLMSIGWVNPHSMLLRGAKIAPLVEQMVGQTAWGPLDFLVVDLPPGTGDVQLALSQAVRVSGCVLVTTPQRLSFVDVVRGVELFDKVRIPTLAVLENMAAYSAPPPLGPQRLAQFVAEHGLSAAAAEELRLLLEPRPERIFGGGHVARLREMWGIEAAFSLELLPAIAASGDAGLPHVLSSPGSAAGQTFLALAAAVERELLKLELAPESRPTVAFEREAGLVVALIGGERFALSPLELRRKCRSPVNNPDACPPDVVPVEMVPMGNYAVSVVWSDGHQSLFPYATFAGKF